MGYLKSVKNSTYTFSKTQTDLFAIGVFEDLKLSVVGKEADKYLDGQISAAITNGDIKGKSNETSLLYGKKIKILVVGLGDKKGFDENAIRLAGGTVLKTATSKKLKTVAMELFGGGKSVSLSQAFAEGIVLGSYQFIAYKTQGKELFEVSSATVINADTKAVQKGSIIASSVCFARDVQNHPGNVSTPTKLSQLAKEIAKEGGMKLTVFDREKFTKNGNGSICGSCIRNRRTTKIHLVRIQRW